MSFRQLVCAKARANAAPARLVSGRNGPTRDSTGGPNEHSLSWSSSRAPPDQVHIESPPSSAPSLPSVASAFCLFFSRLLRAAARVHVADKWLARFQPDDSATPSHSALRAPVLANVPSRPQINYCANLSLLLPILGLQFSGAFRRHFRTRPGAQVSLE